MAENLINTVVSPKKIQFKPGSQPAKFEVRVRNDSKDYASFQLAVEADYDKAKQQKHWYRVSPDIGTLNPPGDLTRFQVELLDSPVPGFVGLMQLRICVSSVELPDKDTVLLPVQIEQGTIRLPLDLKLPVKDFHKPPGALIEIPVTVRNQGQIPTNVNLTILGIQSDWFRDGVDRNFRLEAGAEETKSFSCQLPDSIDTIAKNYNFVIQANHSQGPSSSIEGNLEVLTSGYVDFGCQPKELTIPERFSFAFWRAEPVTYMLKAENASNLPQELSIEITKEGDKDDGGVFEVVEVQRIDEEKEEIVGIIESIELQPREVEPLALRATAKRPWVGQTRTLIRYVTANWSGGDQVDTRNENQTVLLNVKPVFTTSFVVQSAIALLAFLYFLFFLNPDKTHDDAINTVQFNGVTNNLLTGSSDKTILKWNPDGFGFNANNPKLGKIGSFDRAIRVIRYKPVDNNVIAVGLENGFIQLWDLLSTQNKPLTMFADAPDDRVFDLVFTKDSRFLFSGHGSGKVLLWDIANDLRGIVDPNKRPKGTQKFDFSVYGIELLGNEQNLLAIVGRFNQFKVWDLATGSLKNVDYGVAGGQDNYIESITVSELSPYFVATGDNKGYISLWDLRDCTNLNQNTCGKIIERWQDGHDEKAVRTVSFARNGCYLASGGDDGTMRLWYLSDQGLRINDADQGKILETAQKKKPFISVDVGLRDDSVFIASGGEDQIVRVTTVKRKYGGCDKKL